MTGFFSKPKRTLRKMVKNGDYKEALEYGRSIAKQYEKDHDYLFIMGGIHYILDDAENVFYYMDRVLGINPYDTDALHYCMYQGARDLLDKVKDRLFSISQLQYS